MPRTIMLISAGTSVGLTSVRLGVIHAIKHKGIRLNVFKIVSQARSSDDSLDLLNKKKSTKTVCNNTVCKNISLQEGEPMEIGYLESLLCKNQKDLLMEKIIANYYNTTQDAEVVLLEGLLPTDKHQFTQSLNFEIAKALHAEVVFVISQNTATLKQLKERIELICGILGTKKTKNIAGVIFNKLNQPLDKQGNIIPSLFEVFDHPTQVEVEKVDPDKLKKLSPLPVLGVVPWCFDLIATRVFDLVHHLNASVINEGDIKTRRVKFINFCTHTISSVLEDFRSNSLLVTSANRPDVLIAACLAAMNGVEISAILLTDGDGTIDFRVRKLCEGAFSTGLPVLMVNTNTWKTSLNLQQSFNLNISLDDQERIEKVQEYVASYIDTDWIESLLSPPSEGSRPFSPVAFRYHLTKMAREARKRIVLPEGDEPRTVKAASICSDRNIATCVLLGKPEKIKRVADSEGVKLSDGIEIIDPTSVRENYVSRLIELRKNKGMNKTVAREQLKDPVMLGTLMLEQDEVDGLVSGAIHTTANTIRPPLQLIKTAPNTSLVSSVFFMLLPEEVYIYGDCAINPDPTAEQLAEIAIQSAESAIAFGIEPRVAMLSYSTGTSGSGSSVEKVRAATRIAQKKRPDLMIDGPLQYDAAVVPDVAKSKAPNSLVAGRATVFIFPDLNSGNTAYKAVQRSANLISIGPMLQGMRKPVNDLSRGALVEDIIYTIALTAIQSSSSEQH